MSTLKADTIVASDGSSPVTLTKQQAAKHWVNYDAVNQTTDGSFNQSSLTDVATGDFFSTFTNAFSSASDKLHIAEAYNSTNDTSRYAGANRGGVFGQIGYTSTATFKPLSTSYVVFSTTYGAHATSDGAERDFVASYCMSIGDLA
jgi:hypothetical protein